jgi:hypothetical protein
MEFGEAKDNGIVDVGGVNVNEEKMKDYLWHSYLNGKNLSVTGKVMQLELKLNTLFEWIDGIKLTKKQKEQLNKLRI